jgi:hypothetical protein
MNYVFFVICLFTKVTTEYFRKVVSRRNVENVEIASCIMPGTCGRGAESRCIFSVPGCRGTVEINSL